MTDIINEIKKAKQGIVVINEDKVVYYNRREILEGNLGNLGFESFILKILDVLNETKLQSHVLEENSSAILVIDELNRTIEECVCLSRLLDRVFPIYDNETISSIIGIPFEKDDIICIIEGLTFDLTIGQHSERRKNMSTIRLRDQNKQQKIVNEELEFKILELLKKIDKIIYGIKSTKHLSVLYDKLQNLNDVSNNEIKEIAMMLRIMKKLIEKLQK